MRLFIALPIPASMREACVALQDQARGALSSREQGMIRWTCPDQMHLTLVFLGKIDPSRCEEIQRTMVVIVRRFSPLTLRFFGLGISPQGTRPRVFWVGVVHEAELMALQNRLSCGLSALGFILEKRAYRPHLTLGRLKEGVLRDRFRRFCIENAQLGAGSCVVSTLALMESRPALSGSVYTACFTAELGA